MADANLRIDIASEFTGAKAFRDADSAAAKLERTVKNLAKTVGVALTAQALGRFAKDSLKAFLDDEAAANRLSLAVKNLGMEFANPYIANYITQLEQTAKVADDELRPAFQSLLQQTGSLTKAQSILNTAIETSRGSSYDLSTVANDLAQAYVGNTKGLKKYYLGLDAAALKAKSFTEIQEIMNSQFTGSNTAYLATYSGQVGVLSLAWGNFQEKVGGTLLTLASFGDGSEGAKLNLLAASLEKIGSAIELIGKGKEAIFGLLDITGKNGLLSKFNPYQTGSVKQQDTTVKSLTKYEKLLAEIEADRKKQNLAIVKSKKEQLSLDKAKAALAKAQANFDITKINLAAALKGKISKDEEARLMALQAIENNNGEEALKWIAKIDAARKNSAEAEAARQEALIASIQTRMNTILALQDRVNAKMAGMSVGSFAVSQASQVATYTPLPEEYYQRGGASLAAKNIGLGADNNMVVNIKLDGQAFQNAVVDATNTAAQSGSAPWRPNA